MNYYKQFAEMLGLELDQEFNITSADGEQTSHLLYKITKNGVFSRGTKDTDGFWGLEQSNTVAHLLDGLFEAVPKSWKPKYGEQYWSYSVKTSQTCTSIFTGCADDYAVWKVGNCFKTSEEAQAKGKEIAEAIKKEFEKA